MQLPFKIIITIILVLTIPSKLFADALEDQKQVKSIATLANTALAGSALKTVLQEVLTSKEKDALTNASAMQALEDFRRASTPIDESLWNVFSVQNFHDSEEAIKKIKLEKLSDVQKYSKLKGSIDTISAGLDILDLGQNTYDFVQNFSKAIDSDGNVWDKLEAGAKATKNVMDAYQASTAIATTVLKFVPKSTAANFWANNALAKGVASGGKFAKGAGVLGAITIGAQIESIIYQHYRDEAVTEIKENIFSLYKSSIDSRKNMAESLTELYFKHFNESSQISAGEIATILANHMIHQPIYSGFKGNTYRLSKIFLDNTNNPAYLNTNFDHSVFSDLSNTNRIMIALDALTEMSVYEDAEIAAYLDEKVTNGASVADVIFGALEGSSVYDIYDAKSLLQKMFPYENSNTTALGYYSALFKITFNAEVASFMQQRLAAFGREVRRMRDAAAWEDYVNAEISRLLEIPATKAGEQVAITFGVDVEYRDELLEAVSLDLPFRISYQSDTVTGAVDATYDHVTGRLVFNAPTFEAFKLVELLMPLAPRWDGDTDVRYSSFPFPVGNNGVLAEVIVKSCVECTESSELNRNDIDSSGIGDYLLGKIVKKNNESVNSTFTYNNNYYIALRSYNNSSPSITRILKIDYSIKNVTQIYNYEESVYTFPAFSFIKNQGIITIPYALHQDGSSHNKIIDLNLNEDEVTFQNEDYFIIDGYFGRFRYLLSDGTNYIEYKSHNDLAYNGEIVDSSTAERKKIEFNLIPGERIYNFQPIYEDYFAVWVSNWNTQSKTFRVFDFSSLESPRMAYEIHGSLDEDIEAILSNSPYQVRVNDHYFVNNSTYKLEDIETLNFIKVSSNNGLTVGQGASRINIGERAFIRDRVSSHGDSLIDVTDPEDPILVPFEGFDSIRNYELVGNNYLFVSGYVGSFLYNSKLYYLSEAGFVEKRLFDVSGSVSMLDKNTLLLHGSHKISSDNPVDSEIYHISHEEPLLNKYQTILTDGDIESHVLSGSLSLTKKDGQNIWQIGKITLGGDGLVTHSYQEQQGNNWCTQAHNDTYLSLDNSSSIGASYHNYKINIFKLNDSADQMECESLGEIDLGSISVRPYLTVAKGGRHLYVISADKLDIYRISLTEGVKHLSTILDEFTSLRHLFVKNEYLYLPHTSGALNNSFRIYDIKDPASPQLLKNIVDTSYAFDKLSTVSLEDRKHLNWVNGYLFNFKDALNPRRINPGTYVEHIRDKIFFNYSPYRLVFYELDESYNYKVIGTFNSNDYLQPGSIRFFEEHMIFSTNDKLQAISVQKVFDAYADAFKVSSTNFYYGDEVSIASEAPNHNSLQTSPFSSEFMFSKNVEDYTFEIVNSDFVETLSSDISISGRVVTVSLTPDSNIAVNEIVLRASTSAGKPVKINGKSAFSYRTRTNSAPRLADTQSTQMIRGNHSDYVSMFIDTYDADGDTVSLSVVDRAGGYASFDDNQLYASFYNDFEATKIVTIALNDGKETVEKEITVLMIDSTDADNFFSDVDRNSTIYSFDDIAFVTKQAVFSGQADPNDALSRIFRPMDNASMAEVLKVIINAAVKSNWITLESSDSYLKTFPSWASPYYTYARESGAIDALGGDLSILYPTREQLAQLLSKLLQLDEKLAAFGSLPVEFTDSEVFTNDAMHRYGQIVKTFGLYLTDDKALPQQKITRAELASVIKNIFMMPTAELVVPDEAVKQGNYFNVSLDNLKADTMDTDYSLVDNSSEVNSSFAINQKLTLPNNIETYNLSLGENQLVAMLDNDGVRNVISETILMEILDTDNDGFSNEVDAFPNDLNEWLDNDSDGVGDNADTDDDNDDVPDSSDTFPFNALESIDTDADGIGNNEDLDDDNDGLSDVWENQFRLNPLDPADALLDNDQDGISNLDEYYQSTNPNGEFNWDLDDDGETQPLTDGLLAIRYQFGFRGESLINNAIGSSANRKNAVDIEAYIANGQIHFDLDGDGKVLPLTDGLLLLRYLFGFRGEGLTANAIGSEAIRTTSDELDGHIKKYMN